jgi:hypothetical protein
MTHHTKPYFVIAMHRIDGQVLLGEFDSKAERDRFYATEYAAFKQGGMDPDVKEILRGEVGVIPTGRREAEEADLGMALMAQYEGTTRHARTKGQ